jgi:hypothetical protein
LGKNPKVFSMTLALCVTVARTSSASWRPLPPCLSLLVKLAYFHFHDWSLLLSGHSSPAFGLFHLVKVTLPICSIWWNWLRTLNPTTGLVNSCLSCSFQSGITSSPDPSWPLGMLLVLPFIPFLSVCTVHAQRTLLFIRTEIYSKQAQSKKEKSAFIA